ncbi:MAG: hypothetical protein GWN01_15005, partial [Nitrosopumilaceae archaeon]|nr:hypothetical protein [Nitrosopumilaceae archaeon]NIU88560.1 hypothetical protein [Nitrosopumilaceae archaeon]NIV66778.1 hypothetical protein [Nitrosopumilaceae archaeon]NIX62758.1 hypothetical protein [Nitrosopumilaceae archaeon]
MKISKIILYDEPSVPEIQVTKLQEYLKENFPVKIEVRKSIIQNNTSASLDHIEKIASCRILNPYVPSQVRKPTIEEINFEKENFDDTGATENIVMYDGFDLQKTFLEMIPEDERSSDFFHLIFTNKLTCTYDTNDYR